MVSEFALSPGFKPYNGVCQFTRHRFYRGVCFELGRAWQLLEVAQTQLIYGISDHVAVSCRMVWCMLHGTDLRLVCCRVCVCVWLWHLELTHRSKVIATWRIRGFIFDPMRCMHNAATKKLAITASLALSVHKSYYQIRFMLVLHRIRCLRVSCEAGKETLCKQFGDIFIAGFVIKLA